MGMKKVGFFALFLILLNVLAPRGLSGRQGMKGLLLKLGGSSELDYRHIDEEKVEKMWDNCGMELMDIKEKIKNSGFLFMEGVSHDSRERNLHTQLATEGSIREAINLLPPEVNRSFLDCLSKQNFLLQTIGEDSSIRSWFVDCLESLLSPHPTSRRNLAEQPSQAEAPTPGPSQHHVPAHASPPSPSPRVKLPKHDPLSSFPPAPAGSPDPYDFLLDTAKGFSPPEFDGRSSDSTPDARSKNQDSNSRMIIIAVVVTAIGTSIFVALLFCCCLACRKKMRNSGHWQKDDRPLLSLSLSDFSESSQKSYDLESFKNKIGVLSFKTNSSKNGLVSSMDIRTVEGQPAEVLLGNVGSSSETSNVPSNAPAPKPPPPPPVMPPPLQKPAPPPPPGPPPPKAGPRPPPPPKGAAPPRPPQTKLAPSKLSRPSPTGPKKSGDAASGRELGGNDDSGATKTKLKPFFWDKVQATPDHSMVWDQLKAGSFQFNEEMIETLFGYASPDNNKSDGKKDSSKDPSPQFVRILDPKKSQNLAISLRALNVKTEEVCEALLEGNELPTELLQMLLRMAPTSEEELRLRLFGDPSQLGPAERFLKALVDIPFAFQRMEVLLFMSSLQEEVSSTAESFSTIEVACKELKSSRLFLKLLEAVLKTGNRMNDGTFRGGAQAFKLDTLLKLADVRGTDGKTTLLHFVVLEIIRSEGVRAARVARESQTSISSLNSEDLTDDPPIDSGDHFRSLGLKVVSGVSSELEDVKKAAGLDADALTSTVANLGDRLLKTKDFLKTKMDDGTGEDQFLQSLRSFVEHAEADITALLEEERRIRSLVKSTTDYFHGNVGKDEGLRLFVVVRDFLAMLDKVCREVRVLPKPQSNKARTKETPAISPARDPRLLLFPAIKDRRVDSSSSSSDDDD